MKLYFTTCKKKKNDLYSHAGREGGSHFSFAPLQHVYLFIEVIQKNFYETLTSTPSLLTEHLKTWGNCQLIMAFIYLVIFSGQRPPSTGTTTILLLWRIVLTITPGHALLRWYLSFQICLQIDGVYKSCKSPRIIPNRYICQSVFVSIRTPPTRSNSALNISRNNPPPSFCG